jgi:hypothetical protein
MKSQMKNIIAMLAIATVFASCSSDHGRTAANTTADSLAAAQRENDSLENAFLATLDQIDNSIDWVFREKNSASTETGKGKSLSERKQEILRNIELASNMLRENKAKIETLETNAAKGSRDYKKLKDRLTASSARIKKYEEQLASLYDIIADKDWEIDNLNKRATNLELENIMQKGFADKFEDDLHTAWYTKGTYKELRESGVLTKEGGILGIGRTEKLKQNFPDKAFEKIDTRKITSIPIHAKKAKLVTTHPDGTYELKKENGLIASIEIKNPDAFWKTSKHMVIEIR